VTSSFQTKKFCLKCRCGHQGWARDWSRSMAFFVGVESECVYC